MTNCDRSNAGGPTGSDPTFSAGRALANGLLLLAGLSVGLVVGELVLTQANLPRFYDAHTSPPQFVVLDWERDGYPVYLNFPSTTLRFVYDGNPRGYFGNANEVDHTTNSLGMRGGEFTREKGEGVLRIAFLGDSFTFGEGVKDDDVFAVGAARRLSERLPGVAQVQGYNFGVGGYNTSQSRHLLGSLALDFDPDAVVLAYVLNDAEPPLLVREDQGRRVTRRRRDVGGREGRAHERPPDHPLYRLRIARLLWQLVAQKRLTTATLESYRALYAPGSAGWQESRTALHGISRHCRERDVPCFVVLFPLLYRLDDYPFPDVHERLQREVEGAGMHFVDLLPLLRDREGPDLWVHPTDQHPNEEVHAIAAEAIAVMLHDELAGTAEHAMRPPL